jgi:hypothetical protein
LPTVEGLAKSAIEKQLQDIEAAIKALDDKQQAAVN